MKNLNILLKEDEFGLFLNDEDKKIPYYGCKLTKEQVESIRNKKMNFYKTNGQTLFEIRDKNGNFTGECIFYIIFN